MKTRFRNCLFFISVTGIIFYIAAIIYVSKDFLLISFDFKKELSPNDYTIFRDNSYKQLIYTNMLTQNIQLNNLDSIEEYYKSMFQLDPRNGHIALLLSDIQMLKGSYQESSKNLIKSYELYPLSGMLANSRYNLSFILLPYIKHDVTQQRMTDYKILSLNKNG